jgi:hypothetical protein
MRAMSKDRTRRSVIAAVATVLWLGYMAIGLAAINHYLPTENGNGPEGLAAFIGLVSGVVTVGLIMWAASE